MLQPDSAADLGDRGQKQHQTTSLVPTPNQPQNTQCSGTHQRLLPERKTQAYGQCRPLEFPQDLGVGLSFRISLPIYIGSPYQSILHVRSEVRPCPGMPLRPLPRPAADSSTQVHAVNHRAAAAQPFLAPIHSRSSTRKLRHTARNSNLPGAQHNASLRATAKCAGFDVPSSALPRQSHHPRAYDRPEKILKSKMPASYCFLPLVNATVDRPIRIHLWKSPRSS